MKKNHANKLDQYCVFHAGVTTEEALNKIKLYFYLKKQSPEVFRHRNPYSEEMRRCFENQNYCVLPVTPEGYQVYFGCLRNTDVSTFVFNSIAKAQYMSIGKLRVVEFLIVLILLGQDSLHIIVDWFLL